MKPITPDEVQNAKNTNIPDYVIDSFNKLIASRWNGYSATINQIDVINHIIANCYGNITKREIYDNKYLDVESIFESVGWKVEYDKPGYCETYEPNFKFTKRK